MSEPINKAWSKAFQKDKTVGMPLFDAVKDKPVPPMVAPRSRTKNQVYYDRIKDGTLNASRLKVLALIQKHCGMKGMTIQDLNEKYGVPINEASGRTSELVRLGYVEIIGTIMGPSKRPRTLYRANTLCLPGAENLELRLKKK